MSFGQLKNWIVTRTKQGSPPTSPTTHSLQVPQSPPHTLPPIRSPKSPKSPKSPIVHKLPRSFSFSPRTSITKPLPWKTIDKNTFKDYFWIARIDISSKAIVTEHNPDLISLECQWTEKNKRSKQGFFLKGKVLSPQLDFVYEILGEPGFYEIWSHGMIIYQSPEEVPDLVYEI